MNTVKLALPKGRLMAETAALFESAGWGLNDYREGTRSYRVTCARFSEVQAKIFHERDIPIQVAMGNYDLGICGLDWVKELTVKYPSSALVLLKDLAYGQGAVYAVAARNGEPSALESLCNKEGPVRLVSEYPNLAEAFALKLRLKRFCVYPVWGAAEAYPPESADLALMAARTSDASFNHGLAAIDTVTPFSACLIANRERWQTRDLSDILECLDEVFEAPSYVMRAISQQAASDAGEKIEASGAGREEYPDDAVKLALPDGHQQAPTVAILNRAGIRVEGYPSHDGNRRPRAPDIDGLRIKVIRPQDMPMQVAAGNFDLAITGRDWLNDHLYQFPNSPVAALAELKFAFPKIRIVAVVCNDVPVSSGYEMKDFWASRSEPIRIASEYVNIADRYAHQNHFGRYRVVPTWGATEAFLPEDADMLIENTETGSTIARHNLKIIDTLFESTGLLIGNPASLSKSGRKQETALKVIKALEQVAET